MEDILSSIKRIIAEESDPTAGSRKRPERVVARRSEPEPFGRDEVLELREPALAAPIPPAIPTPAQTPTARAALDPAPTPPAVPAEPDAVAADETLATGGAESILSQRTAAATRGPLDALSRMIVKPDVAGSDTLEAMVREMLRPMLREWLDANLPHMVEAMVAREIDRITGK